MNRVTSKTFEETHIISVWMPSMEHGTRLINAVPCADLLLHIVPNVLQTDSFWFVFKGDGWLRDRLLALDRDLIIYPPI